MSIVHYTQYSMQCTLYNVQCVLYIAQIYTTQSKGHLVYCTYYSFNSIVSQITLNKPSINQQKVVFSKITANLFIDTTSPLALMFSMDDYIIQLYCVNPSRINYVILLRLNYVIAQLNYVISQLNYVLSQLNYVLRYLNYFPYHWRLLIVIANL